MTALRPDVQPLILTLALDRVDQERFDALRRRHFPPERNHLAAHVTLFHHLPGEQQAAIAADVAELARRAPFEVAVTGVRSLGRGVAYTLASDQLQDLRAELARRWAPWLTLQDQRRHSPHVTVQNKVTPERARELLGALGAAFTPGTVTATGLALWTYLGGPWGHEATTPFGLEVSP